jgi:hypothetical protein
MDRSIAERVQEQERDEPSTHRKRLAFSVTKSGKKSLNSSKDQVTSPQGVLLRRKVEAS